MDFLPRRLHNVGAPVTSVLGTVFRGADLEAQLNVLARRAGEALPTTSLADTHKKVDDFGLSKAGAGTQAPIIGPGCLRLHPALGQEDGTAICSAMPPSAAELGADPVQRCTRRWRTHCLRTGGTAPRPPTRASSSCPRR
jgi:hypothetical protein